MEIVRSRFLLWLFVLDLLAGAYTVAQEISIGAKGKAAHGKQGMVATAHPLATQAGMEMFQKGGNAVDAAVAAAFAIGVVEPDGSGLGGGGGMLIRLRSGETVYINYYGQTSANVRQSGFEYGKDNRTVKAVLVPGTVAGLTTALARYGTLPLPAVLAPAIRYAELGFVVDETLSKIILDNTQLLQTHPGTAAVFLKDGFPKVEGDTIRQPALARVLKTIAAEGPSPFYAGPIARAIVDDITRCGGTMTMEDLAKYKPILGAPLEGSYRGYTVCSAPPPHSGVTILEALNILEHADLARLGYYGSAADAFHLLAETMRRAYADRIAFLADPRFEPVPLQGLLSFAFARTRFEDIDSAAVSPPEYRKTRIGNPRAFEPATGKPNAPDSSDGTNKVGSFTPRGRRARSMALEPLDGHTTHISVMDVKGTMVSLTQTLGTFFGSGVTASGVLLNNGMSNFASTARVNSVEPEKQPRSSIAPTILLRRGKPFMIVGSPGAVRIPATIVTLIVNAVDYHLDAEATNGAPRFLCQRSDAFLSLENRFSAAAQEGMKKKGHQLQLYGDYDLFFGGAQIILIDSTGTMHGSADPRRGGTAMGY